MAQIMFKRGTQANLDKLTSSQIKDGCFYLTTDSNRFYVGQSTGDNTAELQELNQSVTMVANIASLPSSNIEDGRFYYAKSENILCVYDKSKITNSDPNTGWIQINPDTKLTPSTEALQAVTESNVTKLKVNVYDDAASNNYALGTVDIIGGSNVTVAAEAVTDDDNPEHNSKITISATDTTYTMSAASDSVGTGANAIDAATITLSDGTTANDKKVTIYGDGFVDVTKETNGIKVSVEDPIGDPTIAFVADEEDNTKIGLQINVPSADAEDHKSTLIVPTIKYGKSNGNTTTSAKFGVTDANGVSELTLDTYTTSQIDSMLTAAQGSMDAMEYKGTIASKTALQNLTNVQKGATYKASNAEEYTLNGMTVKTGDLIIFNAADNSSAATEANWDVVPSGDEQVIDAALSEHKLSITDTSGEIGGIQLTTTANKGITLTDTETGDDSTTKIINIQHGAAGPKNNDKSSDNSERNYIQDISVDEFGHIISITAAEETYTNELTGVAQSVADATYSGVTTTGVDVTTTVSVENGSESGKFRIASDNLTVSTSSVTVENAEVPVVSMNLDWGTF